MMKDQNETVRGMLQCVSREHTQDQSHGTYRNAEKFVESQFPHYSALHRKIKQNVFKFLAAKFKNVPIHSFILPIQIYLPRYSQTTPSTGQHVSFIYANIPC